MSKTIWKVGWGFTTKCNMNCAFCYSRIHRKNADDIREDKKLEFCKKFIDKNHHLISDINYGTSENALSEKWFEFFEYVYNHHKEIRQGITTNGTFGKVLQENGKIRDWAIDALNDVDVSLDFFDPKLHNKFRGKKNAYEFAIKTLELCRENGIEKSIVMLATPETFTKSNVEGLFQIASEFDANLRVNIYEPVMEQPFYMFNKFRISYDQFITTLKHILMNHKVIKLNDPLFSSIFGLKHSKGDCTGHKSLRILPNGNLTPSTYLITPEWFAGNIYQNPNIDLSTIKNSESFQKLLNSPLPKGCKKCDFKGSCLGGVYVRRILWYNTLNEKDPYCPFRHPNGFKFDFDINVKEKNKKLVHEDYLPTLIFSP